MRILKHALISSCCLRECSGLSRGHHQWRTQLASHPPASQDTDPMSVFDDPQTRLWIIAHRTTQQIPPCWCTCTRICGQSRATRGADRYDPRIPLCGGLAGDRLCRLPVPRCALEGGGNGWSRARCVTAPIPVLAASAGDQLWAHPLRHTLKQREASRTSGPIPAGGRSPISVGSTSSGGASHGRTRK